jgi:hypothetical protein
VDEEGTAYVGFNPAVAYTPYYNPEEGWATYRTVLRGLVWWRNLATGEIARSKEHARQRCRERADEERRKGCWQ